MTRQIQIILRTDGPLWEARANEERYKLLSLAKDNMMIESFNLSPVKYKGMLIIISGLFWADVMLDACVPHLRLSWVEGKSLISHAINLSAIRKVVL